MNRLVAIALLAVACATPRQGAEPDFGERHETVRGKPTVAPVDATTAKQRLAAALAAGDGVQAARWAHRLGELGVVVGEDERVRVLALVDGLSDAELEQVGGLVSAKILPGPRVVERLVRVALAAGELARADALIAELASPPADLVAALASAKALATSDARVIGVLLPLSGPRAALGKEARNAIELAVGGDKDVLLVFADTAGDASRAGAAVDDLVSRSHPVLLLGPIGEHESAAAAERAAAAHVPIALLSPADGLGEPKRGVFVLASSGEDRARLAARVAIDAGYEAPAVFHPRDDAGRRQADAFAEVLAAAGHPLAARGDYDPAAKDLEPEVKAFLGLVPQRNERLRAHLKKHKKEGWKTFSPDVPFDLLFVPDGHERGALIAAFLSYFNVELRTSDDMDSLALERKHGGRLPSFVRLLGSAGWNHPDLGVRGGQDVEWALVVDVFFAAEPATEVGARFVERWKARFGRNPGTLAAQAFDAATLVLNVRARAAGSRVTARGLLAAAVLDDGACGPAHVGRNGELERGGVLLRVENGSLVALDALPPVGWTGTP